jgi:uncharacterized protein YjdB
MKNNGSMARNMKQILLLLLVGIALFACKEEAIISTPEVVTGKISEVTVASFAYEGNVVADGGDDVTERGVCYSTHATPTVADVKVQNGNGVGTFSGTVTGLDAGKTYFLRAYAVNSEGVGYGDAQKVEVLKYETLRGAEQAYPGVKGETVTVNYLGSTITCTQIKGQLFYQGDILINPKITKAVGVDHASWRWDNNVVYYKIDPGFPRKERVAEALSFFAGTNIIFKERTNQPNYVLFKYIPDAGCYSYVGMIGGEQEIVIDTWGEAGSVAHEIGHAIGLLHEQSKPDRDQYIKILHENIIQGMEHNFDIWRGPVNFSEGFDFNSLMCYHSWSFTTDWNKPTMTKLDGSTFNPQRDYLTLKDLELINLLYPPLADLTLNTQALTITEGQSAKIVVSGGSENYSVSSGNPEVATVTLNGKEITINAMIPGIATITVTDVLTDKKVVCEVTVERKVIPVTGVSVTPTSKTLTEGESFTLVANVQPADADNKSVTWSSSNASVASVDASGKVSALKPGTAIITATTRDGGKTATCTVTVERKVIPVTGVSVTPTSKTLTEGESFTLVANVQPADADNKSVTWSSSNASVASVDASGKVLALKPGTAIITATTRDGGKTATCTVTVERKVIPVTGVSVTPTSKTLTEGESFTLVATVQPADADNKSVSWSSSDAGVASVDASGKVLALKAGTAIITATTQDGGKTATCTVTVERKVIPVTGVSVTPTTKTLTEGESFTLVATVQPADADNKSVSWGSSNTSVASVDASGKVLALKPGTAIITATTRDGGKTATCTVTVERKVIPVTGVSVTPTTKTLTEGESFTLVANVQPADADNKSVTWSSSNASVASVDASGKVLALKPGTAIIMATTRDGGKTATCTVTVERKVIPVTGVSVTPTSKTITEGESFTLVATVQPADADNKSVSWSSSDAGVASVDASGKVLALKAGTAIITATTQDGGKTATCTVTVERKVIPVTGVSVTPTSKTLTEGESFTIVATIQPADADNKSVSWSSSDAGVASVDASGKVLALKAGTAIITATTQDGGKTATCTVVVEKRKGNGNIGDVEGEKL